MIKEYTLVFTELKTVSGLIYEVNKKINEGWVPSGTPFYHDGVENILQPMVKVKKGLLRRIFYGFKVIGI
jgi:hypothetical protein